MEWSIPLSLKSILFHRPVHLHTLHVARWRIDASKVVDIKVRVYQDPTRFHNLLFLSTDDFNFGGNLQLPVNSHFQKHQFFHTFLTMKFSFLNWVFNSVIVFFWHNRNIENIITVFANRHRLKIFKTTFYTIFFKFLNWY